MCTFFCSLEFIYGNLSEAVIIFVSGYKRRRETGAICALFKARVLKFFTVPKVRTSGCSPCGRWEVLGVVYPQVGRKAECWLRKVYPLLT